MSHIFISYSRKDLDFAQKIVDALAAKGLDTWIDWKSIPKGEDWWEHIKSGIEEADVFLFLVSPDSFKSEVCKDELAHAAINGKRILPVVIHDVTPQDAHPEISKRTWFFCHEGQDDFSNAIIEIYKTIHIDYEWLQYHTSLQVKALEWERTKDAGRLLHGMGLREAEKQLAKHIEDPRPTNLQINYVEISRKDLERKRRLWIISLAVSLMLVVFLSVFAKDQSILAGEKARIARAGELASKSATLRESNLQISMLLGVEAYRTNESLQTLSVLRDNAQYAQLNISWQGTVKTPDDSPIPTNIVYSVAISPDGKTLAAGSQDGMINIWSMERGQMIDQPLSGHADRVEVVAFSPDGKLLASGSEDKTTILWDVESRQLLKKLTGKHDGGVHNLSFSPDGKLLASGSFDSIVIWDMESRLAIDTLSKEQIGSISSIAFRPDGKMLAVSSGRDVIFLDASSRKLLEDQLNLSNIGISILVYSPDSKILGGSFNDIVNLWDVETGQPIGQPMRGHFGTVNSIAFSPDGKTLASAGWGDNAIFLWDVETRQPIGEPMSGHRDGINSIVFSPDGKMLISGSRDETVIVWDLDPRSLIQKTCQHVGRNFTQSEWQQYFPSEEYHLTCPQWPPGD